MAEEKTTPLRERMIKDMRNKRLGDKSQKSRIRAIKDFAAFLRRPLDTATPDDLRVYQLHLTGRGVTPPTYNAPTIALRFFCGATCGRDEMKRHCCGSRQDWG